MLYHFGDNWNTELEVHVEGPVADKSQELHKSQPGSSLADS